MSCKYCAHCTDVKIYKNDFKAGRTYVVLESGRDRGAPPGTTFVARKANISFTGEAWRCSINGRWYGEDIAWREHCREKGKRK